MTEDQAERIIVLLDSIDLRLLRVEQAALGEIADGDANARIAGQVTEQMRRLRGS